VARTAAGQQVVLVHGIGGGAWFFFEVVTLLNAAGFSATAVDLSSNGISKAIADDITSIEQYTQPLTDLLSTIDGQVRGDSRFIHNSLLLCVPFSLFLEIKLDNFPTREGIIQELFVSRHVCTRRSVCPDLDNLQAGRQGGSGGGGDVCN
jgi:hypothetical protein